MHVLPDVPDFVTNPNIYTQEDSRPYMVLDFETTWNEFNPSATDPDNTIVLACWYLVYPDGSITRKHRFGNEFEQQELVADVGKSKFVVAHNAKFEAGYLKTCGVDLRSVPFFCTMIGQWVLNGNQKKPLNLNAVALEYNLGSKMDIVGALIKNGVCCSTLPQSWVLEYCWIDVELAHKVFKRQLELLVHRKQLHLAHTRNLVAAVLADIEFEGMTLDNEAVTREYEITKRKRNLLYQMLLQASDGINLNSGKQLGEYLYDKLGFEELTRRGEPIRTETGIRAADSKTLEKLVAKTEEQKKFLEMYMEFNKLDSLLSKNLEFFYGIVRERGGVFKAQLLQGRTVTHRLASTGIPTLFKGQKKTKSVQFQNMPRVYKRLFSAEDDDRLMGECDGAQLEFRVGADVGHDKIATQEIIEGSDIHSVTANVLTEAGEPTNRQQAKASTFAPLYGGGGRTPAQKEYAKFFKEKYKGISSTQRSWVLQVAADKSVRLPWGMIFYWPDARLDRNGRLNYETNVYNYPIQSFATGDIIPIALVYFWHRSRESTIRLKNTIHDSIVSTLAKGEEALFEELSKQCLTTDVFNHLREVYKYAFEVPLGVGIKIARNWGATKTETVYSVWPNGEFTRKVKND
jgi:DNA polymerase I-like protein with 3'-5' exonuclease and polymerase domains